jgi:hypothetical protein
MDWRSTLALDRRRSCLVRLGVQNQALSRNKPAIRSKFRDTRSTFREDRVQILALVDKCGMGEETEFVMRAKNIGA